MGPQDARPADAVEGALHAHGRPAVRPPSPVRPAGFLVNSRPCDFFPDLPGATLKEVFSLAGAFASSPVSYRPHSPAPDAPDARRTGKFSICTDCDSGGRLRTPFPHNPSGPRSRSQARGKDLLRPGAANVFSCRQTAAPKAPENLAVLRHQQAAAQDVLEGGYDGLVQRRPSQKHDALANRAFADDTI